MINKYPRKKLEITTRDKPITHNTSEIQVSDKKIFEIFGIL